MVKMTLSLKKALEKGWKMRFYFPNDGEYQIVLLSLEQRRKLTRLAEVNERNVAEQMGFLIEQAYAALPPCWAFSRDGGEVKE